MMQIHTQNMVRGFVGKKLVGIFFRSSSVEMVFEDRTGLSFAVDSVQHLKTEVVRHRLEEHLTNVDTLQGDVRLLLKCPPI